MDISGLGLGVVGEFRFLVRLWLWMSEPTERTGNSTASSALRRETTENESAMPVSVSLLKYFVIYQWFCSVVDQRPSPPENFTGTRLSSTAIRLSWSHPRSSPVPVSSYLIEYKTMGQWLPLASDTFLSSNVTSYEWRTASLGIIYEFRIVSRSRLSSSRPSDTVIVGDLELSGIRLSFYGLILLMKSVDANNLRWRLFFFYKVYSHLSFLIFGFIK